MQFEYRDFYIDCAAAPGESGYASSASIRRASDNGGESFNSGALKFFPTALQAINYARVWAEMWCDAQLDTTPPIALLRRR